MSWRRMRAGLVDLPAAGVDLSYVNGTDDGTNASSYTYTAHAIGAAAADRYVIVAAACDGGGTFPTVLSVGGTGCTKLVTAVANTLAIWITDSAITTGTTADIVMTCSGTASRSGVRVYRATGLTATTASDTYVDTTAPFTGAIDVPAGGVLIAAILHGDGTVGSWTAVDQDDNSAMEAGQPAIGVASRAYSTLQSGITVAATGTATEREFIAVSLI